MKSMRYFDEGEPWVQRVTVALAPIDAFSGRIVQREIDAYVEGLRTQRPVRNRSGLLVFLDLPERAEYRIQLIDRSQRYFDPKPVIFVPKPGELVVKPVVVPLLRRYGRGLDAGSTTVAGVVCARGAGIGGALISTKVPVRSLSGERPEPSPFEALSGEQGAFEMSLRLQPEPGVAQVKLKFRFFLIYEGQGFEKVVELNVDDGRLTLFNAPVEMIG